MRMKRNSVAANIAKRTSRSYEPLDERTQARLIKGFMQKYKTKNLNVLEVCATAVYTN